MSESTSEVDNVRFGVLGAALIIYAIVVAAINGSYVFDLVIVILGIACITWASQAGPGET